MNENRIVSFRSAFFTWKPLKIASESPRIANQGYWKSIGLYLYVQLSKHRTCDRMYHPKVRHGIFLMKYVAISMQNDQPAIVRTVPAIASTPFSILMHFFGSTNPRGQPAIKPSIARTYLDRKDKRYDRKLLLLAILIVVLPSKQFLIISRYPSLVQTLIKLLSIHELAQSSMCSKWP